MKKIIILTVFFSIALGRNIEIGEEFEADESQLKNFDKKGIKYEDAKDDEDELSDEELIELFEDDKGIVDDLRADNLKVLCAKYELEYSNVATAKEDLKALVI